MGRQVGSPSQDLSHRPLQAELTPRQQSQRVRTEPWTSTLLRVSGKVVGR